MSCWTEWSKGNKPPYKGLYWVTVDEAGTIKMYDRPMRYEKNDTWLLDGKPYCAPNIIAWIQCNMPKEAYNEKHIGYPDHFYLKVTCNGLISYLSKGFHSVKWSMIGYATKEKAFAALKRYKKSEIEQGYKESEVVVVNGNGEEISEK